MTILRLLADDLSEALQIDSLKQELARARRDLVALRAENACLRRRRSGCRLPLPASEEAAATGSGPAQRLVGEMLAYLRQHVSQPLSLGEIAAGLGRNPSYLCRLFVRTTGVHFHDYLDEIRLARAQEMLRDPRRKIAEIAGAAGYASEDWFRHAFKHHTGLSPSAWRQAHLTVAPPA